jgi:transposase InsO family protein
MKYSFIKRYCSTYGVKRMCRLFEVSRSGYYAWRLRNKSKRKLANDRLLIQIKKAYNKGRKTYGSPRITDALNESGYTCGRNRVARLMRIKGIIAKTKRRFKSTTNSAHKLPISPNLLKRNFTVSAPNKIWVADITYIWTKEGWLYLAAVMDLFNRGIVGWSMGSRINAELTVRALKQAVQRRRPGKGLIFHSDRGVQYASQHMRNELKRHGFVQSMSRKGDCWDNSVMESFFHTLKTEHVYFEKYQSRAEAKSKIFEYIEVFYNRQRKHSTLGYKSPLEFEEALNVA